MNSAFPPQSFLWHDYETFGALTRSDRPAQFAAIRTDMELNEIGEPIMHYCLPTPDYLPDPQACLITGITPQRCAQLGIAEYQFAAKIENALAASGTIGVGYNTIRFDDEITRFMFWRNLIDPYAREWQNQCGRWDILDMMRAAYALRPEGIEWPKNVDGRASFKLGDLAAANGITHTAAHDALSDVRATIGLAQLVKAQHPKLFSFCLALRKKERVAEEIGLPHQSPLLHVSGMFAAERGCIGLVWPIAMHPENRNEVIVWDLSADPSELLSLDAETIRRRMFSKVDTLPLGVTRLPIKTIHLNKSPIVIRNLKTLSAEMADRWQLDLAAAQKHAEIAINSGLSARMAAVWPDVFRRPTDNTPDIDESLYGGFIGNHDRRLLENLRTLPAAQLTTARPGFQDGRLHELLFRYRARNFAATLSADERQRWNEHCHTRLQEGSGDARTFQDIARNITELTKQHTSERDREILATVAAYAETLRSTTVVEHNAM